MMNIQELKNMLEDAKTKAEKVYNEDGTRYAKGWFDGQVCVLNHLIKTLENTEGAKCQ